MRPECIARQAIGHERSEVIRQSRHAGGVALGELSGALRLAEVCRVGPRLGGVSLCSDGVPLCSDGVPLGAGGIPLSSQRLSAGPLALELGERDDTPAIGLSSVCAGLPRLVSGGGGGKIVVRHRGPRADYARRGDWV